jgi:hypothetical protein
MTDIINRLKLATPGAPPNPDEAIQKTLAEDAKRRDEQRKQFEYAFHPLANKMGPVMDGKDFEALTKDILDSGLLEPITIKDKMILDGRNRYQASKAAGRTFSEKDFVELAAGVDPLCFVVSKKINRRHLTAEAKREIIAMLLRENPTASSRAIAALTRVSHHTVEAVRQEQAAQGGETATGQPAQLEDGKAEPPAHKRTGRDGKKRKSPTKKRGPS